MTFLPALPPAFLFIPSMNWTEFMMVALAAIMVFGGRLPEVLMQALAQVMRARRSLTRMWRETGLEDELRRVRRDIESGMPRDADFDVRTQRPSSVDDPRAAAERARQARDGALPSCATEGPEVIDPDAERREPVVFEAPDDALEFGAQGAPATETTDDSDTVPIDPRAEGTIPAAEPPAESPAGPPTGSEDVRPNGAAGA